ncbi:MULTISPECIES: hypothetical protein [unclassified Nostoc]|nr:hypothetical protein [Nostoc sp. KVJ20]
MPELGYDYARFSKKAIASLPKLLGCNRPWNPVNVINEIVWY